MILLAFKGSVVFDSAEGGNWAISLLFEDGDEVFAIGKSKKQAWENTRKDLKLLGKL